MKKLLTTLLTVMLLVCLIGCDNGTTNPNGNGTPPPTTDSSNPSTDGTPSQGETPPGGQQGPSATPITPPSESHPNQHVHLFYMGECSSCDITPIKSWDISKAGDNSLKAYLFEVGTKYTLEIAGDGEMYEPDFNGAMPWGTYEDTLTTVIFNGALTNIGYRAFSGCEIESIELPNTLQSIGEEAFSGCWSLKSIVIPANVTEIGRLAFFMCNKLVSVDIPLGIETIGINAFLGCSKLTTVTFGEKTTSIPSEIRIKEGAFDSCPLLANIRLPDNVIQVGAKAFENCPESVITTQDGIRYIGKWALGPELPNINSLTFRVDTIGIADEAFRNCDNLSVIDIPSHIEYIGQYAFSGCDGLQTAKLPTSVTEIRDGLFSNCVELANITLPKYATAIGTHVFSNCNKLKAILIPVEIRTIGASAFYGCDSLEQVVFCTLSLTLIGKHCFYDCQSLKYVICAGRQEHWNKITIEQGNNYLTESMIGFCNSYGHIHTISIVEGTAPSCNNLGYTDGAYCSECETMVIPREEIPMEPHDYDSNGNCLSCGQNKEDS